MAGDGDEVFWAEDAGLLEDAAADFSEREAMLRGIETHDATGLLDGLECYAADGWLLECEVDDGAEFGVIDTALYCDD